LRQPEFIAPQDGAEKQDCESRACWRWLSTRGATYARLNPIYLGDELYSCQPVCEAVRQIEGPFLFVCKPSSHGYNLEHNFGHDQNNLAAVLVILNLLAFACHTVADLVDRLFKTAGDKAATRMGFFNYLRSITVFLVFFSCLPNLARPPRHPHLRAGPTTAAITPN
jgi:hypothetical protein